MSLRGSIGARAPRPTVTIYADESHDLPQAAPVRGRFAFVNPLKPIKIKTRRPLQGVGGGKTKKLFELTRRPGRVYPARQGDGFRVRTQSSCSYYLRILERLSSSTIHRDRFISFDISYLDSIHIT